MNISSKSFQTSIVIPPKPTIPQSPVPFIIPSFIAKADSGASNHYIPLKHSTTLSNIQSTEGPTVFLADDSTMNAAITGTLPLSAKLSSSAQKTHAFQELKTPLISLGQLCDDNCEVRLKKHTINVHKDN